MSGKNNKNNNYCFFIKKEKIKEGRIESALCGLQRLKIIKGYKSNIHLEKEDFLKIDLIVYPNWERKIFLKIENGHSLGSSKEPDKYGIYYLEVTNDMTTANIKTTIMEILLAEMEKRERKNNIALR